MGIPVVGTLAHSYIMSFSDDTLPEVTKIEENDIL